ncbi:MULTISPECIES: DUF488 family protein [Roseivirga]|uniref:DUF488 domain-containing protein n=1 Tax=Roseivirga TaxID=290180 RepID=UPI00257C6CBC|nr:MULTISPECIES: DUF488 family protein [Roseivirga]MEC7755172.1 DUF488 family protein [Bacteroidota bacterium]|tara:strand:+ start:492 stop:1391 length:900 start_codon:yes stop_codon:yes gene_type:complete
MFYRRKLILATLEEFGGKLNHTNLQKILFLITRNQEKKAFDFVPYKYGCFSFQANQDISTLTKYKLVRSETVANTSNWVLTDEGLNFYSQLKKQDQSAIRLVKREISNFSQRDLIRHTYIKYPYYASKSQIASEILNKTEMEAVEKQKRNFSEPKFFTIGYEGISLETYLNKLIINDIRLLCDVRKNSLSMKYGFSKSQLKNACQSIGIKYIHIPELGIESEKRQDLESMSDYNKLFEEYENTTLINNKQSINYLFQLTKEYKRVAITCFEKEVCMCHRGRVLNALKELPQWDIQYKNL